MLIVPMIPPGVCFQGTTTEILNQYGQQIIGQALIDVPGLGDVTPAQILALQEEDIRLQNEIDALSIDVRSGTIPITTGDNNIPIVFVTPLPDANYSISIEFIDGAGAGTTAPGWAVVGGTKNASGVTIRCYDIVAAVTDFFYVCRRFVP